MEYLVYILAGFGIFSLMVILLKLIIWCFKCECNKKLVPIGESQIYTLRNSMINMNESETIEKFDQMLEQYTKPKVVISRQCICPFCAKQTDKIVINDSNNEEINCFSTQNPIIEEMDNKTDDNHPDLGDTYIEVDDILIIDDMKEDMPCNMYNNVILELKNKFSAQNQTEVKKLFDHDN